MTAIALASAGCMASGAATSASISNRTPTAESVDPANATAGYRLGSDGQAQETNVSGTYVDISGEWETGGLPGSLYECRVTVTSGTLSSGTSGSWLSLGSTQTWTRTRSGIGSNAVTFTVEIRDANTLTVLDTATVTLTATVTT